MCQNLLTRGLFLWLAVSPSIAAAAILDDIATNLNNASAAGVFAARLAQGEPVDGFFGGALPPNVIDGLHDFYNADGMTAVYTKPVKFAEPFPTFTAAELSFDGPLGDPSSVNNTQIQDAVEAALAVVDSGGIDTDKIREAFKRNHFHDPGVQAGGVRLSADANAATFFPGWTIYSGQLGHVWDGNTHIVMTTNINTALIVDAAAGGSFIDSNCFPKDEVLTVIHELIHAMIYREGINVGNNGNEEDIVHAMTIAGGIVPAKMRAHIKAGMGKPPTDLARMVYKVRYDEVAVFTGGVAVMQALGITRNQLDSLVPEPPTVVLSILAATACAGGVARCRVAGRKGADQLC